MNAEIISIGNELLNGHTVNSNASYIAGKLTEIGVPVNCITAIGDSRINIVEALEIAEERSEFIILTGGLGPTHDDITKFALAQFFQSNLVMNQEVLECLIQRFQKLKRELSRSNKNQCLVPNNAQILKNEIGTAPGLLFHKKGKYFFVLPGVPAEMQRMVDYNVVPFIRERSKQKILIRKLRTFGMPESTLFETLGDVHDLEKHARIAFLPNFGLIDIQLTVMGNDLETCKNNLNMVEEKIRQKVGKIIWGTDRQTFEELIVKKLVEQNKTLSIVEYGTSGDVSTQLINYDEKGSAVVNGLLINSIEGFKNLLNISVETMSANKMVIEKMTVNIAQKMKQLSNTTFSVAVMHNVSNESTSFMTILDGESEHSQNFSFPYQIELSRQRLATAVLNSLLRYLSK